VPSNYKITIGAKQLQDIAGDLESHCQNKASNIALSTLLEKVDSALQPILNELSTLTPKHAAIKQESQALDKATLKVMLIKLRNLVEEDDAEATFVIHELNALPGIAKHSHLLRKLTNAIDSYDFDEGLELLIELEKLVI